MQYSNTINMKHKLNPILAIMIICISHLLSSCQEFLDAKPRKEIVVPETLEDMQAMLDNTNVFNRTPTIGLWASDDLVANDEGYLGFREDWVRMAYTWDRAIFETTDEVGDWTVPYQQILYCNIILEKLREMGPAEQEGTQAMGIKGTALYFRANAYYILLQLFSRPYGTEGALGVPLKLDSDVNQWEQRPPLEENYRQVFDDLANALALLPESSIYWTRPNLQTAHGLLARIYLSIGDYGKAEEHATSALEMGGELLVLSEVEQGLEFPLPPYFYPVPRENKEVLLYDEMFSVSDLFSPNLFVAGDIVDSYEDGDLRKAIYLYPNEATGGHNFIGNYTGDYLFFSGLTVSEMELIKLECMARRNALDEAVPIFNQWLATRYRPGDYTDQDFASAGQLLDAVLLERRKELPCRGILRWTDLRRLNREPEYAKTLSRTIDGKEFVLEPQGPRYVFPIPPVEIQLNGLEQNP
ncbi:RagB/SusD family nutrient uptake outer membrane protein [Echinicola strongylocentroti]|uniref:RagB/SusD family nutrient uptake outer membrane protein n=2 Tax=Echinicola strongylocentroti TaxID=1795355 RepID=A0A2Z4IJX8_9BACT|nr:RagB/SusD family nutrient uptake outer membrane protein [Echinicola strongylocentroti]